MEKQRISYVDPESIDDADMRAELEPCRLRGQPRPESQAIRAHVPATFWSFANTWQTVFHEGICDHTIKELCRVYVSHSVKCEFCGNQRSIQSLHGEHAKFADARLAHAQTAMRVFDNAAELAPVLGLAGTLVALAQAPGASAQDAGLVGAIAMAVITTLYGLVAANFVFAPIGSAIGRKSRKEERDREAVLEWLEEGIRSTGAATSAAQPASHAA